MKWLYGLLCLFFLIIFHEFGHFLAAKLFGVKVESFSIGFGPVLFHKKIKDTDFRLSLIPLGGYCGMKGEKDFQTAIENNLSEIHADKDSFYGVHSLKRAGIVIAGPFFNFIFSIIAYSLIAGIGYYYYTYSNTILINENVTSNVAKEAGVQSGDKIIAINNVTTTNFSELIEQISSKPEEEITLKINRNNEIFEIKLKTELDKNTGTGKIGIAADTSDLMKIQTPKYNFYQSILQGFKETFNSIYLTFKSFKILFKGINLDNSVSGPIRVTEMLGSTVKYGFSSGFKQGFTSILSLMAIISVSLFIMNLLPIPVLDGGVLLIAIIEFILHKKVNPKFQYYIQFIGLAFIAVLFIIGLKGDISFLLKK